MQHPPSRGAWRATGLAALTCALALGASACASGTNAPPTTTSTTTTTASAAPTTTAPTTSTSAAPTTSAGPTGSLTLWHFFTDREAGIIQTAVDGFMKEYPGITVTVQSGQDDDKMRTAIAAGANIDVGISYSRDQLGVLCTSGAFIDLAPLIAADGTDLNLLLPKAKAYTEFKGKRCALPMLGDATGLYYNTAMFADAGITSPPKTLAELSDDAVKLTTYKADGSIDRLGFMPLMGYYETTTPGMAVTVQAAWFDDADKSTLGTDPGWTTLFTWQRDLIDRLGGFQKLNDWMAGLGDEFSEENDFHTGRLAMMVDGEWRTAFLADQAPDLKYATAPLPMSADHASAYGAGLVDGNLIGIPKGSKQPELAWLLVKYLAMNTDAQVSIGNGLRNVPTLLAAAQSPALEKDANYQVFLDAFENAASMTSPSTIIGVQYQDLLDLFVQPWQSGDKTDLAGGLADVAKQIDAAMALGG